MAATAGSVMLIRKMTVPATNGSDYAMICEICSVDKERRGRGGVLKAAEAAATA